MRSEWKKTVALLTMLIAYAWSASASYPLVTNFNRKSFGGGAQTWAVAQDSVGRMYFGNSNGLVTYNSRDWLLTGLPNGSTVRSLLFSKRNPGRLYVGASEDFGYFEYDAGRRTNIYHSLAGLLPVGMRSFKEVWDIHEVGDDVWFRADNHMLRYDGKRVTPVAAPDRITASLQIGERLIAAVRDNGLVTLQGSLFKPLEMSRPLAADKICALLEHSDGVLVVTESDGLWLLKTSSLERLETDIDGFLRGNQVFCATSSGPVYAFGTVGNGVVIKDFGNGKTAYANIETGTQNNTVLNMAFDRDRNLWLGLDNGIDYLAVNAPYSSLLGSPTVCGAGYCSYYLNDILYLGTNQGLYLTPYPVSPGPRTSQPAHVLNSQVWNIEVIGDKVFVCSDAGLNVGAGDVFKRIEGVPGTWDVRPLRKYPGRLLASTYNGFYVLEDSQGGWVNRGRVAGYSDIGGHFVEDREGDIWISHWLKGIYRLRIDPVTLKVTKSTFYNSADGLPSNRNCAVTSVDGEMLFSTESGLYTLGKDNRFRENRRMNKSLALNSAARLHQAPNRSLWIVSGNGVSVASRNVAGEVAVDSITYGTLADQLIPGFDNFNFINDTHVIVSNRDGFYDIDLTYRPTTGPDTRIVFDAIYADGDSLLFGGGLTADEIPIDIGYGHNSLKFEFVMPEYRAENAVTYSCWLENYDSGWSGYTPAASKEYTRLGEGRYRLHVRAINSVTRRVTERVLSFRIMPPWYRTTAAKIVYAVLFILALWGCCRLAIFLARRETRRIARRKEEELEQMRRQAREEALHKDYQIAELKGRQLEQDVKHKTEELSNITMNVVRKNEILLDISGHLTRLSQNPLPAELTTQIEHIQQLIRQNINHDEDWRSFVHNFDAAYEDFTKKLLQLHPTLTRTELRVGCYIRMGLSSKDIAPLFNISHRSVEMTRYRLRKKLNLQREANLTEYLQAIS